MRGEATAFYEQLFLRVERACIAWPYARLTNGYACLSRGRKSYLVSRLICEHLHGPAPSVRHEAAHSCNNGHDGCVNPQHLRWATPVENAADKVVAGTDNRGERCGTSKLTEKDVVEIRTLAASMTHRDIAARFSVARTTVTLIVGRKNWAWLP